METNSEISGKKFKLFSLHQIKEEITMSKENAIEFFKLTVEKPELLDEAKKHDDAENFYDALSKIAKEKDLECSPEEIEEAESMMSRLSSGELDESDLESVAGGSWISDAWSWCKKKYNEYGEGVKEAFTAGKKAWDDWRNKKKQ